MRTKSLSNKSIVTTIWNEKQEKSLWNLCRSNIWKALNASLDFVKLEIISENKEKYKIKIRKITLRPFADQTLQSLESFIGLY